MLRILIFGRLAIDHCKYTMMDDINLLFTKIDECEVETHIIILPVVLKLFQHFENN